MIPKLTALALRRMSGCDLIERNAEHLRCGEGVNVNIVAESLFQRFHTCHFSRKAQFDLRIIDRQKHMAFSAMKASRMRRPSSVRIGMFYEFGSGGGEAARACPRHRKRCVNAACLRIDLFL